MSRKMTKVKSRRADLTFKHNLERGRHGWLRLTPAYSVKLVNDILDEHPDVTTVLDPFSGSGTTGVVCAERGIHCDLLDINPFLVWFGRAKTTNYTTAAISGGQQVLPAVLAAVRKQSDSDLWTPPIHNIERWWSPHRLRLLAKLRTAIGQVVAEDSPIRDLFHIAFCRAVIEWSNAAFNHQSMSFKDVSEPSLFDEQEDDELLAGFSRTVSQVLDGAATHLPGNTIIREGDSRQIPEPQQGLYDCVITSPPYPNRMSYIRELRPYMYWLGYIDDARDAAELDWKAIGGTWGIATSRVGKWVTHGPEVPHVGFSEMIREIGTRSELLANYVHKYFVDATLHIRSLVPRMTPGGKVFYIVGNSKFYDTMVPVEHIYASILADAGFVNTRVEAIRKRNSKKELFEFVVSGNLRRDEHA
jgi:hypothetical protein